MPDSAANSNSTAASAANLYTFWVSHFSEKARWALEFEGIPFTETTLLPGPHLYQLRKLNPRRKVPVLCFEGQTIAGSGAIVDALVPLFGRSRLQPWRGPGACDPSLALRSEQLETLADECFGRATQAIVYQTLLDRPAAVIKLWNYAGPWWGRAAYTLAYPLLKPRVARSYCRDVQTVAYYHGRLIEGLDTTDALLSQHAYLLGDSPTRVDLAVAALLAVLVRPAQHPMKWPKRYPAELERLCAQHEARPTWQFVRRMYQQHRGRLVSE